MGVEMKGGMTGEMKIEESLCLKGSAPSDGRDGELFVKESTKIRKRHKNVRCSSTRIAYYSTCFTFKYVPLLGTEHSLLGEPAIDGTTISEADCNACSNSMKNDDYEIVEQFLGKDKKTL